DLLHRDHLAGEAQEALAREARLVAEDREELLVPQRLDDPDVALRHGLVDDRVDLREQHLVLADEGLDLGLQPRLPLAQLIELAADRREVRRELGLPLLFLLARELAERPAQSEERLVLRGLALVVVEPADGPLGELLGPELQAPGGDRAHDLGLVARSQRSNGTRETQG